MDPSLHPPPIRLKPGTEDSSTLDVSQPFDRPQPRSTARSLSDRPTPDTATPPATTPPAPRRADTGAEVSRLLRFRGAKADFRDLIKAAAIIGALIVALNVYAAIVPASAL